ncbi:MAG: pyridoxamine 5'-phosphate oxidase family protein [Propionibacteriales bacterium]|nr:pyridoxamine 5'-phosphate oxidase family protein [Propionibacteriales bacterium]
MVLGTDIRHSVGAASVAELAWLGPDGRPDGIPVTPLLLGNQPAVAFTYAYAAPARQIGSVPAIALVLSDPRMTGTGWRPGVLLGRPRLIEDRDGQLYKNELLAQELRKYPPSRTLADSLLLRRENWWYLPRLIVTIDVASIEPIAPREGDADRVLAVHAGGLELDTVQAAGAGPDRLRLTSLAARHLPDGQAALLGHDFSVPDLERWTPWLWRGDLAGGVLSVSESPERTTLEPVPKLRQRFRRHRKLERACRAALQA